MAKIEKDITK